MIIDSSGNVGIGSMTAPLTQFAITQTTTYAEPTLGTNTGSFFLSGNGLYGLYMGASGAGNAWMQVMRNDAATAYNLHLQPSGGNVTIGTNSPFITKLVVSQDTSVADLYGQIMCVGATSTDKRLAIGYDTTSNLGYISSYQNGVGYKPLHLNYYGGNVVIGSTYAGGNLGIGKNSPGQALDVTGAGVFSSTVTATNFILSSDRNLKTNIEPIVAKSVPIQYKQFELISDLGQPRYGVVAQELEESNPELVRKDADGVLSVAYIDLLIMEIAALKQRVLDLETKAQIWR
jgi:hypothetical protein